MLWLIYILKQTDSHGIAWVAPTRQYDSSKRAKSWTIHKSLAWQDLEAWLCHWLYRIAASLPGLPHICACCLLPGRRAPPVACEFCIRAFSARGHELGGSCGRGPLLATIVIAIGFHWELSSDHSYIQGCLEAVTSQQSGRCTPMSLAAHAALQRWSTPVYGTAMPLRCSPATSRLSDDDEAGHCRRARARVSASTPATGSAGGPSAPRPRRTDHSTH